MKICGKCKKNKDTTEFHKSRRGKDGLDWCCKQCEKELKIIYRLKIPKEELKRRADSATFKYRYGITLIERDAMIVLQNGKCAICSKVFTDKTKPHIDHNHSTKKVRGILCAQCNFTIGCARENTEILRSAIVYLNQQMEQK